MERGKLWSASPIFTTEFGTDIIGGAGTCVDAVIAVFHYYGLSYLADDKVLRGGKMILCGKRIA